MDKENIRPTSNKSDEIVSPPALSKSKPVLSDSRSPSPTADQRIAEEEDTQAKVENVTKATLGPGKATGSAEKQSEHKNLKNMQPLSEDTIEVGRRTPVPLQETFILEDGSSSFDYSSGHRLSPASSPLGSPIIAEKKAEHRTAAATISSPLSHSHDLTESDAEEESERRRLEKLQKELKQRTTIINEKKATLQQLRLARARAEEELSSIDKRLSKLQALETELKEYQEKTKEYKQQFQELVELLGQSAIVKEIDRKEAIINDLLNLLSEVKYKIHEITENKREHH